MILGVGSFAHSIGAALKDAGAGVSTYLTRNYGHYSPTLVGKTFSRDALPSPVPLIQLFSTARTRCISRHEPLLTICEPPRGPRLESSGGPALTPKQRRTKAAIDAFMGTEEVDHGVA